MSIALTLCTLGMLRMDWAERRDGFSPLASFVGQEVVVNGFVSKEPDLREQTKHVYIRTETDTVLAYIERLDSVQYGDLVTLRGELHLPESFTTDLGRTFNYPGYLRASGVEYVLYYPVVQVDATGEGNLIIAALLAFKQRFMTALEGALPEPHAGLSEGLLLGVKQALGADLELAFRQTGIIHIVVLSGYNVMLVVAFVMFILAFLLPVRSRAIVGILAIIAFALLVGLSATVVRASIMASIFLLATILGRSYDVLRALFAAGTIMIFINPHILVFDVGFQLSFLATLGLIMVAPQFETFLATTPRLLGAKDFLVATVATQIAVLPLLLYQVGELSIVSVIVNVLVLPMVPIAMLLTFVTGIVALMLPVFTVLPAGFAYLSLEYILIVTRFFAALPFAAVTIPTFPFYFVPIGYALLGIWWLQSRKKNTAFDTKASHQLQKGGVAKSATPPSTSPPSDTPIFFQ